MQNSNNKFQIALGFAILGGLLFVVYWLVSSLGAWLSGLDSDLAVGMITASTTIIVATLTVVLGKYFERVREAESHLREKKIELYDEFLTEFFQLFYSEDDYESERLTPFLQEWQRKLIVWGGPSVFVAFVKWKNHLAKGTPDAGTIFTMDKFFKEMRRDIGLSNKGLERGFFAHTILRHATFFLDLAKKNPQLTMEEAGRLEDELGLNDVAS